MKANKKWIKTFFDKGIFLKERYEGLLWWRKQYYYKWAQNVHNFHACQFAIDADWFDTLTLEKQLQVYNREERFAYNRSLVEGGNPELVSQ